MSVGWIADHIVLGQHRLSLKAEVPHGFITIQLDEPAAAKNVSIRVQVKKTTQNVPGKINK